MGATGSSSPPEAAGQTQIHLIDVICELARHRDIRTTRRYIHVTEQRRHDAINRTFTDTTSALR